ncbi:hypothetical protein [Jidongwangia harbinensis]|uniref:hypothetical protein n=1 Tax=Jidongwangia harbinensis TaxID=2878561 RepID=UPI001CD9A1D0|nr:hypothetical protein [Jidongwangia harbinensis]MCA2216794.1 hypothetical protein [Jidongwangia harbinensis]
MAARRWPADLSATMRDEWHAELAALDTPGTAAPAYRKLVFAGSLVLSPAVDEPSWRGRAAGLGRTASVAAGLTLLAAALVNAARATDSLAPLLLTGAAVACAAIGARVRVSAVLVGAAAFAFLLAGNRIPVMPFMGVLDIGPAVVTWTALTAVLARYIAHLTATGRRRRAAVLAAGGGLAVPDLATIAGSLHAADALGVAATSAPTWFPLALLPGGITDFGRYFADGTAAFGSLQAVGPAFHASDILLANAAVMAGPLLLCTTAVLASALRPHPAEATEAVGAVEPRATEPQATEPQATEPQATEPQATEPQATEPQAAAPRATEPQAAAPQTAAPQTAAPQTAAPQTAAPQTAAPQAAVPQAAVPQAAVRVMAGTVAALAGLAVCHLLLWSGATAEVTLHRMLDNSTVFGFGFAAHPAGRGAVALLAAVLVMRAVAAATPRPE